MKKKRGPQKYPEYARLKVIKSWLKGEDNWGWRYPPLGGICLHRKMWIEYCEEERKKPVSRWPLGQRMHWNYSPRRGPRRR